MVDILKIQWNPETKDWYQDWLVEPGKLSHAGGVAHFGGGLVADGHFDTKYSEAVKTVTHSGLTRWK